MFEIRIHGRGGQGVVSAAELLSVAAFREGQYAQAFPSFGSERMGAPVMSFCRMDTRTIRLREPVMRPDALIIQDPTLLHQVNLFEGLSPDGFVLLNTARSLAHLGLEDFEAAWPRVRCQTVPASEFAMQYLKRPVPNAALLGAFAALTGKLRLESVIEAVQGKFKGEIAQANVSAVKAAFDFVRSQRQPALQQEVEVVPAN